MKYAGIGSRKTPDEIIKKMIAFGELFAKLGLVLRSGGASGADTAFECGANNVSSKCCEIWLPFKNHFHIQDRNFYPSECHFDEMEKYHPVANKLKPVPKALHARNMGQILGVDLVDPVSFVLCWTPDGCDSLVGYSSVTGGTGTAICCASAHGIPVFNMATMDFKESFGKFVSENILTNIEV